MLSTKNVSCLRCCLGIPPRELRLATSLQSVTRLHLPHAIEVRLHVCKIKVVSILNGGAVAYPCRLDETMDVAWSAPHGAHYYHTDVIYLLP